TAGLVVLLQQVLQPLAQRRVAPTGAIQKRGTACGGDFQGSLEHFALGHGKALRASSSCAKSARKLCQEFVSIPFQLLEEPGLGVGPEAVCAAQRQTEQVRRI